MNNLKKKMTATFAEKSVMGVIYHQTSNISHTLVDNKIRVLSVGTAPTTSSFSTWHMASMDWAETTARRDDKHLSVGIWCVLYMY